MMLYIWGPRSGDPKFVPLAFRGPQTSKTKSERTFQGPKHVQHVGCIAVFTLFAQCVAFDYFGVVCRKQSMSRVTPPVAVV